MASNDDLAPSPLDLLPPPPLSPPPLSLPSQTHATPPTSRPSRPIPIEIYNHILHFAFGRHLPPIPLEDRLDEPPSLSPLLPLTLVSKGLRELVLPYLYHHLTIRRNEDWIQLFDPEEGILVGEGEEQARKGGWVKKLSLPRGGFPVARWIASRERPVYSNTRLPEPKMALLDFSGLVNLVEVCVGQWRRDDLVQREVEAVVEIEMEGGPCLERMLEDGYPSAEETTRDWIRLDVEMIRSIRQTSSVLALLSETNPTSLHIYLIQFPSRNLPVPALRSLCITLQHLRYSPPVKDEDEVAVHALGTKFVRYSMAFPSSRYNLDLVLEPLSQKNGKLLERDIINQSWTKDEAGWWTWA